MTNKSKSNNLIAVVNEIASIARQRGIAHLIAENQKLNGKSLILKGKEHIHFGSCGYLGLEFDPRLIEAGIDALRRFGSQFSSSRTYVSISLYQELEQLLNKMFKRPVIISTCCTLGHQAIIPIIVDDEDAVILDQQAHVSMQEAAKKLQLRGITVTVVKHNRMDELQNKIEELSPTHNKIWYLTDGVYSMYGDFCPVKKLTEMADTYKQFHLYIDDAHGMSWTGENGTGYVLSQTPQHPKMTICVSLSKGFASGGGAFILPNDELYWKIKNWGGALTYSGPEQPSVIGTSIASAKIHLSEEIYDLHAQHQTKIAYCNEVLTHHKLPLVANTKSPIFFIGLGLERVGYNMVKRLSDDGLYVNLGIFPAVPQTRTGIRFTITNHHSFDNIEFLAERIAYHLPKALREEGRTLNDIQRAFKSLTVIEDNNIENEFTFNSIICDSEFSIQYETTISKINQQEWDSLLGKGGSFDWNGLLLLERAFSGNQKPEDNWSFHYYIIRDRRNEPVIATFFTSAISKDDLLAPEEVSKKIEIERKKDFYYLTSKALMMGSLITNGEHIYIDRNKNWKSAFNLLLEYAWKEQEKQGSEVLYLRDFNTNDNEIKEYLMDQGFIQVPLPDNHVINNSNHLSEELYLNKLHQKKRYHIKHDVLKLKDKFTITIKNNLAEDEIEYLYKLYENVRNNNLEINSFLLPKKLFKEIANSSSWDVLVLSLNEPQKTIAFGLAYKNGNYCPIVLGIDYDYLNNYKAYKQILYQFLPRGLELKSEKIILGFTASLDKRKLGAEAIPQVAYIQVKDTFKMSLMDFIPNTKVA